MERITPMGRIILDMLDTHDVALTALDIFTLWPRSEASRPSYMNVSREIRALVDSELIESTIGRLFTTSAAGRDALWALLRADAKVVVQRWVDDPDNEKLLPHPVHFESRSAMREYLRGAAGALPQKS